MMQTIKHIKPTILMLLTAVLLFCGCVERELQPKDRLGNVELSLDWGELSTPPQSMSYLFYNQSGVLVKEEKSKLALFSCQLPEGRYRIIAHDAESHQIDFRGMEQYETAEIYVPVINKSKSPLSDVNEPKKSIYGIGRCKEFEELVVVEGEKIKGTVAPEVLTKSVGFKFSVESSDAIAKVSGVLGGAASGVFLSSQKSNNTPCSVPFIANRQAVTDFSVNIQVFDLIIDPKKEIRNTVQMVVEKEDGTVLTGEFDLTDALQEIMNNNGGEITNDIPLDMTLSVKNINQLTAIIKPWNNSGTGGGDAKPNKL